MNTPLISVIVPVYNVEKYLPKCLDSIIAQTYQNIEIILVDDESPDRSGLICDEYAERDSRIKVIHKKNAGVNEARIAGFKVSSGEYITFVDSDDYVSPLYVERLYAPFEKYDVDFSCVQWIYVNGEKQKPDVRSRQGYFDSNALKNVLKNDFLFNYQTKTSAYNLGLCCKMTKRCLLVGAMERADGLWMGEDIITNLYIAYHTSSMYISSEYLYYYIQHSGQATKQIDLATWANQVEQWNRIVLVDRNNYLRNQMPYRILHFFKHFLRLNMSNGVSLKEFSSYIDAAVTPQIVNDNLLNYNFVNLRFKDKMILFCTKHHHYKLLYLLSKMVVMVKTYD